MWLETNNDNAYFAYADKDILIIIFTITSNCFNKFLPFQHYGNASNSKAVQEKFTL